MTKEKLINFEKDIAKLFEQAKIPYPVHLSGGNEEQLIKIFKKIKKRDYIFSTHRSHYHYLLKGGNPERLKKMILEGKSMHVFNKKFNFLSSSIVAGTCSIAAGVALALKRKKTKRHVWCFIGDGAEDSGHFYEAVKYVNGHKLPCTFIIEDNNRSVETPKIARYGRAKVKWPGCVKRYRYNPTYPHVGIGKWVELCGKKVGGSSF
ncbi:MAG: hypothetical protein ISS45_09420 [Candidatus Omnitrophica bacterium]|nr:hypothetical protein [Candidatus Omnitrophota bacterium]